MNIKELIKLAVNIATLPNTYHPEEFPKSINLPGLKYSKANDDIVVIVTDPVTSRTTTKPMVTFLKQLGNWEAAIAYALLKEYQEYVDNVMPHQWVRMEKVSSLLGYETRYNEDTGNIEDFEESEYGVFFGCQNNIKIVSEDEEVVCTVDRFLTKVLG